MKKVTGLLDLIQIGVDRGTTAVEEIHMERIETNFAVVKKIPLMGRISARVQDIHMHHTGGVYAIIRLVNQEFGNFAKFLVDGVGKLPAAPRSMAVKPVGRRKSGKKEMDSHRKYVDFFVSIVNGVIGDFLKRNRNGLAIPMAFYRHNHPLCMTRENMDAIYPKTTSKICILVHGLACNEKTWEFPSDPETTYGALLEKDLGYTSFYLRYNTGLHISENGRHFSALLTDLLKVYPKEVEEVVMIGHSMGGLVIRSACWFGQKEQADWIRHVKKIVYLASPHLGAPLEKFGNVVSGCLKRIPTSYTRLIADIIDLRSSGIKDLRFGNVIDEDWDGHDPDIVLENNKSPIPLMGGASHYAVSGSLTKDPAHCFTQLIGDPMVPKSSAFGRSGAKEHTMIFCGYREFSEIGHIKLAHSHRVYHEIKIICSKQERK